MIGEEHRASLVSLLAWYREMGIDDVVAGTPTNWLEQSDALPGQGMAERIRGPDVSRPRHTPDGSDATRAIPHTAPSPLSHPDRRAPPLDADSKLQLSEPIADPRIRKAASLADLRAILEEFEGCSLRNTAKSLCFYRGSERSRLMIIGEAPGRDEDIQGKPFVGRAGQLLDRMLAAIGLSKADVHITNVVYWRPPGNRTPTPQEVQACRPFLERQVALVEPDIVLLLGGSAAKHILDTTEGIMRLRGQWRQIELGGRKLSALATLHPAYLLRTPAAKRMAWIDLRSLAAVLARET